MVYSTKFLDFGDRVAQVLKICIVTRDKRVRKIALVPLSVTIDGEPEFTRVGTVSATDRLNRFRFMRSKRFSRHSSTDAWHME